VTPPRGITVRPIPPEATHPLRQKILRIGQPAQASIYPGDEDPRALHLGAFDASGALVGIATLCRPEDRLAGIPPYRSPGLRFRGMAVEPTHVAQGVGALLLAELRRVAKERGARELWANARASAVGFYVKQGFKVVSTPFEITGLGPHLVVAQAL
jgi:GNAT superfamily N-acetyltransferase